MVESGISLVRIGDFAWSRIEPDPGHLAWNWLDRAIGTLAEAGLQIVMCTPTATPPKWLVDQSPDILAVGADGQPRRFGSRRHYDFSSPRYFAAAQRIVTEVAGRYGRHPAVSAWQTDNEYGCHDTVVSYSAAAASRFRLWLRERYGTAAALNQAWGTVFWGGEYRDFDEIDPPIGTVTEAHPAHRLDYRRFASDEVVRFNRMQVEILRQHCPGRLLLHNFMQFFTGFDHYQVAAALDVAAWDSYPLGALERFWLDPAVKQRWLRTGHPDFPAFHHDLYRGMSKQPFWVMEQQPGPVNWAPWNPAPLPGMVRLWTWEAFAHGAGVVSYFRWRQCPFGQEQMHAGLRTPDDRLDVGGEEASRVAAELKGVPVAPAARADVALLFDYDAQWLLEIHPHGADFSYLRLAFEYYSALRALGLDVDVLPASAPLDGYRMVVIPSLPVVPPDLPDRLERSRACAVVGPRSGSKTETVQIPDGLPPGRLRALLPLRVWRVESLRPDVTEAVSFAGNAYRARQWRELVRAEAGVEVEGTYGTGEPAIVKSGRVRYLTGVFDAALHAAVLSRAAEEAGLAVLRLPDGLRVRRRGALRFAFNYGPDPIDAPSPPGAAFLVGAKRLGVADVAIWKE